MYTGPKKETIILTTTHIPHKSYQGSSKASSQDPLLISGIFPGSRWEFSKIRGQNKIPHSRVLILRTPTKRTPPMYSNSHRIHRDWTRGVGPVEGPSAFDEIPGAGELIFLSGLAKAALRNGGVYCRGLYIDTGT